MRSGTTLVVICVRERAAAAAGPAPQPAASSRARTAVVEACSTILGGAAGLAGEENKKPKCNKDTPCA